jgi:hypothetical protein
MGIDQKHYDGEIRTMEALRKETVAVENVNHPGQVRQLDAELYGAMKDALLEILPASSPGLTLDEVRERVSPHLPEALFPGGARAGWWTKTVQLDLEARGILVREKTRPLRLRRA